MNTHVIFFLIAVLLSLSQCQTDYGQSSTCTARAGKCMSASTCDGYSGSTRVTGICPGPSTWQCCVADFGQKADCTSAGGKCMWDNSCPESPRTGLCPGPTSWKCCVQSTSTPPTSGSCTSEVTWLYNNGTSCTASSIGGSTQVQTLLIQWIADLKAITPTSYGCLKSICHAGYARAGCTCASGSLHCCNPPRAVDISKVIWEGVTASMYDGDHASSSPTTRLRYIAIDALLRRNLRYVLDGWYNAEHKNHFHADDGDLPTRYVTSSSSDTFFIQAACKYMLYSTTVIDGAYGPQTSTCITDMQTKLGVSGNLGDSSVYRSFLYKLAQKAINGETL